MLFFLLYINIISAAVNNVLLFYIFLFECFNKRVFDSGVRMERACPNYRAGLPRALLHWSEGTPRTGFWNLLAGIEPGEQDVSFGVSLLSLWFLVLSSLTSLLCPPARRKRRRSGQAAAPPVWMHVCFLRERTDFRPGAGTEGKGKKKRTGHANSHAQMRWCSHKENTARVWWKILKTEA